MNKRIEELAKQVGFSKDKYQLYWDENSNTEGVDLEKFAELIIQKCMQVSMDSVGLDAEYEAWYLIGQHFGVNNEVSRTHHRISPKT